MKVHKGERISPLYWWMAFPPVAFAFYAFIIFSLCRRLFVFSPSVFVFLSFPGVIRGQRPLIVHPHLSPLPGRVRESEIATHGKIRHARDDGRRWIPVMREEEQPPRVAILPHLRTQVVIASTEEDAFPSSVLFLLFSFLPFVFIFSAFPGGYRGLFPPIACGNLVFLCRGESKKRSPH